MSLISVKKIGAKTYRLDGNSYFIAGLFIFLFVFSIVSLVSCDIVQGVVWAFCFTILVLPIVALNDFIGKKRHKSIHETEFFRTLKLEGFRDEKFGEYHGLVKTIDQRTVRVYYDWSKQAKGFFSFGDIVLNVFYFPLVKDLVAYDIDAERLKMLNKKYDLGGSYGAKYFFDVDRMVIHLNYYPWFKTSRMNRRLKEAFATIKGENLEGLDIDNVIPEMEEHKESGVFLPNMELIWNELEKNANTRS